MNPWRENYDKSSVFKNLRAVLLKQTTAEIIQSYICFNTFSASASGWSMDFEASNSGPNALPRYNIQHFLHVPTLRREDDSPIPHHFPQNAQFQLLSMAKMPDKIVESLISMGFPIG